MTAQHQRKSNRQLPRLFYRWHRRIGASAALFVIWIVISGWLLNHSDSLNLAQYKFHSSLLASWYNLNYQLPTQTFSSQNHWLVDGNASLLLDGKLLDINLTAPVGLAEKNNLVAAANSHEIILFSVQGELLDKLSDTDLPIKNITNIGNGCDGIAITDNTQTFSTSDGISWKPCEETLSWSTAKAITSEKLATVKPLLVPDISAEKIIVDMHTGRFFGRYGPYVVDAIGACLLLLALSGLWLFFKMGQRK